MNAQEWVLRWFEFAVASTALLGAIAWGVARLRQPIDRVNLIVLGLLATALLPMSLSLMPGPRWHVGLFAALEPATTNTPLGSAPPSSADKVTPPNAASVERTPRVPTDPQAMSSDPALSATETAREPKNVEQSLVKAVSAGVGSLSERSISAESTGATEVGVTSAQSARWWSVAAGILGIAYAASLVVFLSQSMVGTIQLRRLCRRAAAADETVWAMWQTVSDRATQNVKILISDEVVAPLLGGGWRPTLLLPRAIAEGDSTALRFCLAHEWAHIQAGDLWAWRAIHLCRYVLWYQPWYWSLRRELRVCQDLVADDRAVGARGASDDHLRYCELLLSLARQQQQLSIPGAIAFHDRASQLTRRITLLLTSSQVLPTKSTRVFWGLASGTLLLSTCVLSSIRWSEASSPVTITPAVAAVVESRSDEDFRWVRGRVVDEQDHGVAGAQLIFPLDLDESVVLTATADADGNFELKCPMDQIKRPAWERQSSVWAYAPGYNLMATSVYEALRQEEDPEKRYTLRLSLANEINMRVLRPDGEPLADVEVRPQYVEVSQRRHFVPKALASIVTGMTNQDGRVILSALGHGSADPDHRILMVTQSVEFGQQHVSLVQPPDGKIPDVKLKPTASVRGRFLADNPAWAAGIRLQFNTRTSDRGDPVSGFAEVISDAQGRFEVPRLAIGNTEHFNVRIDPQRPVRPVMPEAFTLIAGEVKQLQIPVVDAPKVFGRVVSKTNAPIANAGVSVRYGHSQIERGITDENGRFEMRSLPGDVRVDIFAAPLGFSSWDQPIPTKPLTLLPNAKGLEWPTIQLSSTVLIRGQLIDEKDRPLANRYIDALERNRHYGGGLTDADGNFEISVPEGAQDTVRLRVDDRAIPFGDNVQVIQYEPLVLRFITNTKREDLEAARATKADVVLVGQVLLSGQPIAGVPILVERRTPYFRPDGTIDLTMGKMYPSDEQVTDAEGRYRLKGLKAEDEYTIYVRPKFGAVDLDWPHYRGIVPRDAEEEVVLSDVKLEPLSQSIGGLVVDPDGKPVPGAKILAQLRGRQRLIYDWTRPESSPVTTSDAEGRFQIKELPERDLSIYAYLPVKSGSSRFPVQFDIERNQQDIRIVLDPSLINDED
jgi:beta-lactamase regulating signal transducer with metallopeptidase domain